MNGYITQKVLGGNLFSFFIKKIRLGLNITKKLLKITTECPTVDIPRPGSDRKRTLLRLCGMNACLMASDIRSAGLGGELTQPGLSTNKAETSQLKKKNVCLEMSMFSISV